ncbi:hypothetical protein RZS08_10175, partial [Arthrospira platensis SPKY1]|nr:hypothetical protein [Arthrospira platensis SPKY1]
MANFKGKQLAAGMPAPSALDAVSLVTSVGEYLTKTGDAIGDIVEMGAIPAGCVPVDVIVDNGALGASATLDVGILSGAYGDSGVRTMGNEFIATGAAATAGVLRRNKVVTAITVSEETKSWGIKFQGANP